MWGRLYLKSAGYSTCFVEQTQSRTTVWWYYSCLTRLNKNVLQPRLVLLSVFINFGFTCWFQKVVVVLP